MSNALKVNIQLDMYLNVHNVLSDFHKAVSVKVLVPSVKAVNIRAKMVLMRAIHADLVNLRAQMALHLNRHVENVEEANIRLLHNRHVTRVCPAGTKSRPE